MKTMNNGIGSVKTVRNLFYGVELLTAEQQEALVALFATFDFTTKGEVEIEIGDAKVVLNLQGRLGSGELSDVEDIATDLYTRRVNGIVEALYKPEVFAFIKRKFEGMQPVLSYGWMRNTLERRARHYESLRSSARTKEEKAALRKVADWLLDKATCRKMLNVCGKLQTVSVNTYEYVGSGRYRIAILTPERK